MMPVSNAARRTPHSQASHGLSRSNELIVNLRSGYQDPGNALLPRLECGKDTSSKTLRRSISVSFLDVEANRRLQNFSGRRTRTSLSKSIIA